MNKTIFIILLAILSFSCGKKEKSVEVINADFKEYRTYGDLTNKEDESANPIGDIKGNSGVRKILLDKIKANPKYGDLLNNSIDENTSVNKNYEYMILVNETGTVDKIVIEKSMGEELDNIVIHEVSDWKFRPAVINGENVKFKYPLQFDGTDYFISVEQMPEPIGGIGAIAKLVRYPEIAKRAGIEGRVYVKAFVNEQGEVDSVKLIKGIGVGCNESAMDAVKQTKFKPAMNDGQEVKAQVVVPILFKLK